MAVSAGMQWLKSHLDPIVFGLTILAVVFPVISIAVSQIFLGLAILGFLLDWLLNRRKRLRFPPIKLPLLLFVGATLASWMFSPEPEIGLPPIYKFWLFAIILLVANYFSKTRGGWPIVHFSRPAWWRPVSRWSNTWCLPWGVSRGG